MSTGVQVSYTEMAELGLYSEPPEMVLRNPHNPGYRGVKNVIAVNHQRFELPPYVFREVIVGVNMQRIDVVRQSACGILGARRRV